MKKYLTTPIYYVNGEPHIGSAYTTLAVDTLARYWRQKIGPENVLFLTGTDENSQKTVEAAAKENMEPGAYLDMMADKWKQTFQSIGVSFDDFIRTTEPRHHQTVQTIIQTILDTGDIYKGTYKGKYCVGCESFKKESDLTEDGLCPDHMKAPKELEEENYFFRLSKYEQKLKDFYLANPNWLQPETRKNEIVSFLEGGLDDISVSRESAELGIPMPNDPNHKIYVWFDALINYYTAINTDEKRDFWQGAEHILGKDISRFHCVIWPAMLMSAGIDLPQSEFVHGFFTVNGQKMGKSLGNVIHPLELAESNGNDCLRVGLLSSFEFGNDGDFSREKYDHFYDTKLAGGVGNLFHRVITLIHKFLDSKKPIGGMADTETPEWNDFCQHIEAKKMKHAIDMFFGLVDNTNQILNDTEVWKLAKTDLSEAEKVFAKLLQKLEIILQMSHILLPETAPKMKTLLGDEDRVGEPLILFPRREV